MHGGLNGSTPNNCYDQYIIGIKQAMLAQPQRDFSNSEAKQEN